MGAAEERLKELLGELDSPMFLLTVAHGGERAGCLVGFATQASIAPPRFLACVSRLNHTFPLAMASPHVAVHIAPADDLDLARLFGEETGDEVDKFAHCAWHDGPEGQPIVEGCPGWFVGRVRERFDLGDHVGLLLDPVAVSGTGEAHLRFEQAKDLEAGHPA
jgi:flavin reductase (DIM6/NTAB) family NADH-FMN oxidoreductase RutF